MAKEISISPKYGLNPSLDLCFWCGEAKGVAILGRIHEKKGDHTDLEAPKGMVFSLEPCDKCKERFKQGIHLIEVCEDGSRFRNNEAFAFRDGDGTLRWPTGRWAVLKPEAVRGGKAGGRMLCDEGVMYEVFKAQKPE